MTSAFAKRNITAKVQIRDEVPAQGLIRISEFIFTDVKSYTKRMGLGCVEFEIEADSMVTTDIKDLSAPTHIHTSMIYPPWTEELPKKDGWYWVRFLNYPFVEAICIKVRNNGSLDARYKDNGYLIDAIMFCGPIPEPPMEAP